MEALQIRPIKEWISRVNCIPVCWDTSVSIVGPAKSGLGLVETSASAKLSQRKAS